MERLKELQDAIRKVLNDETDPSEIDLEDKTATFPVLTNLSKRGLEAEHYRLSLISVAAKSLGLGTLEMTTTTALSYINVLYKKFYNQNLVMLEVSKEDIAETALALLHELETNSTLFKPLPPNLTAIQRKYDSMQDAQRVEDDSMQDAQRVEDDSMQDAQRVEDDSMQDAQRVEDDSGQVGSKQADEVVPVAGPSGTSTNETQGNKQTRKNIPGDKKKTKTSEQKRKHNTPRSCPLCRKVVCNLPRHLDLVHVQKNENIPPVRVKALTEMARHGNKVRGGKSKRTNKSGAVKEYQRFKEICPLCDSVVLYLNKHLQRVHHRQNMRHVYVANENGSTLHWQILRTTVGPSTNTKEEECHPAY